MSHRSPRFIVDTCWIDTCRCLCLNNQQVFPLLVVRSKRLQEFRLKWRKTVRFIEFLNQPKNHTIEKRQYFEVDAAHTSTDWKKNAFYSLFQKIQILQESCNILQDNAFFWQLSCKTYLNLQDSCKMTLELARFLQDKHFSCKIVARYAISRLLCSA